MPQNGKKRNEGKPSRERQITLVNLNTIYLNKNNLKTLGDFMRRDHEAALYATLDKLYMQGSVAILWNDLYLWYNADRLNKSAFRDITSQWKSVCEYYGHGEEDTPELEEIKHSDTWFLLTRKLFAEEERVPLSARTD